MPSNSNVQAGINSEIHASLRRLEDADYVNNLIRDEEINTLVDQANEANSNLQSQIDHLTSEVYQLHRYIEPHIQDGDLRYFQTVYCGNIQVSNGGHIYGNILFDGTTTFNYGAEFKNSATFRQSVSVMGDGVLSSFTPHTVTIDGTAQANKVLATGDLSFSWAGLVRGSWSSQTQTYTVESTNSHTELASTTITVTPSFSYDRDEHKYRITAGVTDEDGHIIATSGEHWSGTEAYEDGGSQEAHSHSATLEYLATVNDYPTFRRIGGERIGTGTHTVYW